MYPVWEATAVEGLELSNSYATVVKTDQLIMVVRVEGQSKGIAFMGPVPIGQSRWLSGVAPDPVRVFVELQPRVTPATFNPRSLRLVIDDRRHEPSAVRAGATCHSTSPLDFDSWRVLAIKEPICLAYNFSQLRPLSASFSLVAEQMPEIRYSVRYESDAGFVRQ
jgi:hypothetical protein